MTPRFSASELTAFTDAIGYTHTRTVSVRSWPDAAAILRDLRSLPAVGLVFRDTALWADPDPGPDSEGRGLAFVTVDVAPGIRLASRAEDDRWTDGLTGAPDAVAAVVLNHIADMRTSTLAAFRAATARGRCTNPSHARETLTH